MKKVISVLLVAMMLMSAFAVSGFAFDLIVKDDTSFQENGVCTCGDHDPVDPCHCCIFCTNLDPQYITSCAKDYAGNLNIESDENGNQFVAVCCANCDGIWPCSCGCECCKENENLEDDDNTLDNIIDDNAKQTFVDTFQKILKQISDAFDEFFDAIFEFLRLDEVIGRGDK